MSLLYLLLFGAGWQVSVVVTQVPTDFCTDIGRRMMATVYEQEQKPVGFEAAGYLCVPVNPVIEDREENVFSEDDEFRYDI